MFVLIFIYDTIIEELDDVLNNVNPCGFCNNVCDGVKHRQSPGDIDGCCYSFDFPKHTLFQHNYFRTQEEIITKLLAKNYIPYFIYYWGNYYSIL